MSNLSDKALLVNLSISAWAGRKKDKNATESVAIKYSAKNGAGNYTKKLLPGAKELDRISSLASSFREYFRGQSLPWLSDGTRILSGDNYLQFTAEYRTRKNEFDSAVRDFIAIYPSLKTNAQSILGDLYNAADYPDAHDLHKSFNCDVAFMPLPDVTDFRIEIGESEKLEFANKMQDVANNAVNEVRSRLFEVVNNAALRLKDPNAKFRDSLLSNVTELCELLPRLNITNDLNIEKSRLDVISLVESLDVNNLRKNAVDRNDAAEKLESITRAMGSFMGGAM